MFKALGLAGLASLMLLMGCGGGGDSVAKFSGTVATGAPMVGAKVEVFDASGALISTVTTDSKGGYQTPNLNNLTGPYVIKATLDGKSFYSVNAKGEEATVNVTPHTTLIAALLSPSGNAENLSTEIKSDKSVATEGKINIKKEIVKNIIHPVTKVLDVASIDPISSSISADGQGYDRALDSTHISIMPEVNGNIKSSNIQVTYKTKLDFSKADKSNLKTVGFKNTTTSVDVSNINFTAEDFIEAGQMPKILAWVKSNNDCMKLPHSQRWEILQGRKKPLAQVCKNIFFTGDIHTFIADGRGVEDLFGLFEDSAAYTEDVVTQTDYVYSMINNGRTEIMIHVRALLSNGAYRYLFFNLTKDPDQNNELRWRGNDNKYWAAVSNYNQMRKFPYSPDYDATLSGYQFDIPSKNATGQSLNIDKVIVTTPRRDSFTLRDTAPGLISLSVCNKDAVEATELTACSQTPFYILQSQFMTIGSRPSDSFVRPVQYKWIGMYDYGQTDDEDIQNLPTFGTYKFEIYIKDKNDPVTQYMPYFGRPKTHSEILQADAAGFFPKLTQSTIESFGRSKNTVSGEFDAYKVVIPDSKNPFKLIWTGMANFLTIYGEVYRKDNENLQNIFEIIKFPSHLENTISVVCNKIDPNDKQCLEAPNAEIFATGSNNKDFSTFVTYISLGNFFSEFANNVTAYSFFAIENSKGWE